MTITPQHVASKLEAAGLVPTGGLARRWSDDFERDGFPVYSAGRYGDLSPSEQRLARREGIVFGTGPYVAYKQTCDAFEAIVTASLSDLAAL